MSNENLDIKEVAELLKRYKEMKTLAAEGEKELSERLLKMLKDQGAHSIVSKDGWKFSRATRVGLKVKKGQEEIATEWAEKNNALKIDLGAAYQISRRELKEPPGFERSETTYISTKSPNSKDDDQD